MTFWIGQNYTWLQIVWYEIYINKEMVRMQLHPSSTKVQYLLCIIWINILFKCSFSASESCSSESLNCNNEKCSSESSNESLKPSQKYLRGKFNFGVSYCSLKSDCKYFILFKNSLPCWVMVFCVINESSNFYSLIIQTFVSQKILKVFSIH